MGDIEGLQSNSHLERCKTGQSCGAIGDQPRLEIRQCTTEKIAAPGGEKGWEEFDEMEISEKERGFVQIAKVS